MIAYRDSFNIHGTTFTSNSANSTGAGGGVMVIYDSSFNIISSTFTNNSAFIGGVMITSDSSFNITSSNFTNNSAADDSGGSLYIFNSNLNFSGYTRLENNAEQLNKTAEAREEGGAITSFQSTVIFTGVSSLSNNQARRGGAILAIESKIMIYGEMIIANNTATVSSGGGISLQQSDLEVRENCIISGNDAVRGGGIHATQFNYCCISTRDSSIHQQQSKKWKWTLFRS